MKLKLKLLSSELLSMAMLFSFCLMINVGIPFLVHKTVGWDFYKFYFVAWISTMGIYIVNTTVLNIKKQFKVVDLISTRVKELTPPVALEEQVKPSTQAN